MKELKSMWTLRVIETDHKKEVFSRNGEKENILNLLNKLCNKIEEKWKVKVLTDEADNHFEKLFEGVVAEFNIKDNEDDEHNFFICLSQIYEDVEENDSDKAIKEIDEFMDYYYNE